MGGDTLTNIRYLLDENTPHAVRDQLLLREPEMQVLVIGETPICSGSFD